MLNNLKIWFKQSKVRLPVYIYRTLEKFYLDTCSFHAATLTFYTLFALVPFLGLMFGLAQSFGFEQHMDAIFKSLLEGQETVYENLLRFSDNMLNQTKEEVIAGIGLIILLWSVYKVFMVLDHIFNQIWAIRFQKNPFFRIHQFAAILLLLPLLLVISGGGIIVAANKVISWLPTMNWEVIEYLPSQTKLISILLFSLLFGLSYWGLPAVSVPITVCLISGVIASLLFHGLQYIYIHFQKEINEFGIVYGSFASIPLFMMWVYISWVIYLLGAEFTYIFESRITRAWQLKPSALPLHVQRALLLEITQMTRERLDSGKDSLNAREMSRALSIPIAIIREMLDKLIAADLITQSFKPKSRTPYYIPAKSTKLLTDDYIIYQLEHACFDGRAVPQYGSIIEKIVNKHLSKELVSK